VPTSKTYKVTRKLTDGEVHAFDLEADSAYEAGRLGDEIQYADRYRSEKRMQGPSPKPWAVDIVIRLRQPVRRAA
jgi:hypothetical protein